MSIRLNKRVIAALIASSITMSLVGCNNNNEEQINKAPVESEYQNNSNEALLNISDDYEYVLKISNMYLEARDNNDSKKLKEFYDNMRDLYLEYDETKARKASALLPYFIEAEVLFNDTEYSFTDEEMLVVDQLYLDDQIINGYTIPEFEKIYNEYVEPYDFYQDEEDYNSEDYYEEDDNYSFSL